MNSIQSRRLTRFQVNLQSLLRIKEPLPTARMRSESVEVNRGAFSGDILPREVGAGSGYADLGVPERVASKLNLQTLLSAGEAKPTARIEAVAVKDRPTP